MDKIFARARKAEAPRNEGAVRRQQLLEAFEEIPSFSVNDAERTERRNLAKERGMPGPVPLKEVIFQKIDRWDHVLKTAQNAGIPLSDNVLLKLIHQAKSLEGVKESEESWDYPGDKIYDIQELVELLAAGEQAGLLSHDEVERYASGIGDATSQVLEMVKQELLDKESTEAFRNSGRLMQLTNPEPRPFDIRPKRYPEN